ncbi:MAG TPA: hypothetical protein VMT43_06585 [Acidimicrobiales bacterium]|nr:hypothetical protein [Acidimicrobiales bacterium]
MPPKRKPPIDPKYRPIVREDVPPDPPVASDDDAPTTPPEET